MVVYKDSIVRRQVHAGFKRLQKPTTIVMHGTAGGGTLSWWRYGSKRHPENKFAQRHKRGVGLTHYLILTNGKVIEIYDPATRWVYHSSSGRNDALTIGIELENKNTRNLNEYTDAQYKSAGVLVFYLMRKFGIIQQQITTHDNMKITRGQKPKGCPGPKFSMQRLIQSLEMKEVQHEDI